MKRVRIGGRVALGIAVAVVSGACSSDWATWGNGNQRQSANALENKIGPGNVAQLHQLWSADLGGAMNAAPVLAHDIDVNGTPTDVLFVGTEGGVVFAVTTEGRGLWYRGVGSIYTGCSLSGPGSVHGVTGTAVFDRAGNRLFVAGGDGKVYALNPATGAVLPGWPVRITTNPLREIVWSAPTLVSDHLYVEIASNGCDTPPNKGRVVDIRPSTHSIAHTFYIMGSPTGPDGAGVWGWGGASVDAGGDVYIATGNALTDPENEPYSDSIVRLSSSLVVKAYHTPISGMVDDDFGSTPTLFQAPDCPPQLVALQKNGSLYLYDRASISAGFRQRIVFSQPNLIGVASYSSASHLVYVVNGKGTTDGTYQRGVAAFKVNAQCNLELAWQTPLTVSGAGAPVIANGVVYASSGGSGKVYALNAFTGAVLWDSGAALQGSVFAQPIVVDGRVYAASYDNHLHAFGL
jgi:outer membrane protein assembly factor BamB